MKSKRPCSYNDNQKKRGVQSGYLRGLEFTLGWFLSHTEGVEQYLDYWFYQRSTTKLLKARSEENEDAYALHTKRWAQSHACQELERVLCGELPQPEQERNLEATKSPEVLLPFLGGADSQALSLSAEPHASDSLFAKANTGKHEQGSAQVEVKVRRNTMLRLPADPWPLLDYFFAYTQCWFPIIERQDVLRTVHLSSNRPVELCDDALPAHLFELWAILALASVQKEASARSSMGLRNTSDSTCHALDELCDRLITLVPLVGQERMEISHIRAMLLLAIVEIERQHWSTAWLLSGHASRVAIDIGLHETQASTLEPSSALPSKRAKHVMLGCFILDSAISFKLRRSPFLQSSDIVPIGLLTEDGLEEWNSWEGFEDRCQVPCRVPQRSISIYNALVELMRVLSQSTTPGSCHASCFKVPSLDLLGALTNWQVKLPGHINFTAIKSGTAHPTPQLLSLYFIQHYLLANVCNHNQREQMMHGLYETRQFYADFLKNINLSPMIKCFSNPEDEPNDLNDILPTRMHQNYVAELGPQEFRAQGISPSRNEAGLGNISGVQNLPDIHMDQSPAFFARSRAVNGQSPSTMNTSNVRERLRGRIETPFFRPSPPSNPESGHNAARIPRPPFNTASTDQLEVVPILNCEGMDCSSSMPSVVTPAVNYGISMPAAHDANIFDDLDYLERANE